MKRFRALLRALALLTVLVVAAGVYVAYAPYGDTAAHPFNQNRNAVWLEHRWLEKPHSIEDMEQMFRFLDHHGVVYAYPHLIPFDSAGRLPLHNREQMRAFLASARRVAPNMKVLPWVGGLRVGYKRSRAGTIDLGDLGQRQRMVAECRGLMDEGFDGIHLNVEPMPNGDDDFLALLRALRAAVGTGNPLPLRDAAGAGRARHRAQLLLDRRLLRAHRGRRRPGGADDLRHRAAHARPLPPLRGLRGGRGDREPGAAPQPHARAGGHPDLRRDRPHAPQGRGDAGERAPRASCPACADAPGGTFEGVALYAEWTTDPEDWEVYERVWRGHTLP